MSYTLLPEYEQDSDQWHEARQESLGASEVAAVLGLSPWQSPLSVYMSKMGIRNDIDENLAYFGHALESPIAQWVTDKHPEVGLVEDGFSARSSKYPWLTATPDRVVYDHDGIPGEYPIEIKTSSAFSKDKWADGVPLYYQTQVQTQMLVLGAPYGWLAVLHGGNQPELYPVPRDDDFIETHLIPKTKEFWEQHVLTQIPPEPVTSAEAIELWPGDPELSVEGGEPLYDLWGQYGLLQAEQVEASDQLAAVKLELQKAMADATELTYQGQVLFTWKPRKGSSRLDGTALKKELPDVAAKYTKEGAPTRTFIRKTTKEVDGL